MLHSFSPQNSQLLNMLMRMDMHRLRFLALFGTIVIYGAFGSPTPDHPGGIEMVIGLLLIMAVGMAGIGGALRVGPGMPLWHSGGQAFLIMGLSLPLVIGIGAGAAPGAIIRDLAPFLFMMLPIFMADLFARCPRYFYALGVAVAALGILFAVRAVNDVQPLYWAKFLGGGDPLYYLANMPSVLFAAILCAGLAGEKFIRQFTPRALGVGLILIGLSLLCLWPLALSAQRASLSVFILSMLMLTFFLGLRYPLRTGFGLLLVAMLSAVFWGQIETVLQSLSHKTELVGVNMRFAEIAAVWREIAAHPLSLLWGKGWGASFASPAVADITVYYTHGLLSTLLLKTGVIGLFLGAVYLAGLARLLWALPGRYNVWIVALAGPVLIDVFLYASFKSLDFGLVLLLISALAFYARGPNPAPKIASSAHLMYAKGAAI